MASARDLLQKADTLMRSNRNVGAADADESVPLLTDIALPPSTGVSHRQQRQEIPVLTNAVKTGGGTFSRLDTQSRAAADALQDTTIFPLSQMPALTIQGAIPAEFRTEPAFSVTAMKTSSQDAGDWDAGFAPRAPAKPAPAAMDVAGPVPPSAAAAAAAAAPVPSAPSAPSVLPATPEPTPSAAEIAETVYYQVLQNLDLYTERALQEHLTSHLSPILERASRELLATLHANLGALIRQYVAEAIEKQLGVRPESSK